MNSLIRSWRSGGLDGWLLVLLVGLASVARFQNGYVIDDLPMIVDGTAIHDVARIPSYFVNSAQISAVGEQSEGLATYRPLALVTMTLSSLLSGREPWAYHLTGLLLHLAVVGSLWWIVRRTSTESGVPAALSRVVAGVVGLWFGLHPELCEAHVWINGRSDVIAALGLVWCAYFVSDWARRGGVIADRGLLGASFAFLLACFGKETALFAMPALLVPVMVTAAVPRRRSIVIATLALMLPAAVFLVLRTAAVGEAAGTSLTSGAGIARAALQLGWYWVEASGHVLVPRATGMRVIGDEYMHVPVEIFALGWLLSIGLAAWTATSLRRRPMVAMGLLGFAGVLAPVALVSAGHWPGWGRYLYAPTALLALGPAPALVMWVAQRAQRSRGARVAAAAAGAVLLVWFVGGTGRAVRDYRDFEAFYAAAARDWPGSSLGHVGQGELLHAAGRYVEAIPHLEQALASVPTGISHLRNLAVTLVFAGRPMDGYALAVRGLELGAETDSFHNVAAMAAASFDPERAAHHWLACAATDECAANLLRSAQIHPARDVFVRVVQGASGPPGSPVERLQRQLEATSPGPRR